MSAVLALAAAIVVACPESEPGCAFVGGDRLQAAIDATPNGGTLIVRRGDYALAGRQDLLYQDIKLRAALLIRARRIAIQGDGARLHPAPGTANSAFGVEHSDVRVSGLTVTEFGGGDPHDRIYEGHGLFAIDSRVRLDGVRFIGLGKMAVTGRGTARIDARRVTIENGHVGFWIDEQARLNLREVTVRNVESAAVCAYAESRVTVVDSHFDQARDDALYTAGHARMQVSRSIIERSQPFGVRAAGDSRITVSSTRFARNARNWGTEDRGQVTFRALNRG